MNAQVSGTQDTKSHSSGMSEVCISREYPWESRGLRQGLEENQSDVSIIYLYMVLSKNPELLGTRPGWLMATECLPGHIYAG